MWNLKESELIDRGQTGGCQRQQVGVGKLDKGVQKVQTFNYNIKKTWT